MERTNEEIKLTPQQKYRASHREQYNRTQRELYNRLKQNEEWRQAFNQRAIINNTIYRRKLKVALLQNPEYEPKRRGRPKKVAPTPEELPPSEEKL
jgi:hypothetical protein